MLAGFFSRFVLVAVAILLAGGVQPAVANDWPSKQITIIVPFPAGGGTDALQRFYARKLAAALNQTVVVENVGGAGGAIGGQRVARSAPDGYTILGTVVTSATLLPHIQKMSYDPIGDFTPVVRLADSVGYIGIHKDTGISSLKELVDKARAAPNKYRYASAGIGSILQIRMEELNRAAGISLEHVPYQGGSAYLSDIISGRVDIAADGAIVLPQAQKGVMNVIATFADKRSDEYPNVPTVREIVPQYEQISSWQVYMVPAGTPPAVVKRLSAEIRKISAEADTVAFLKTVTHAPILDADSVDVTQKVRESYDFFQRATAKLGLEKQ